MNEPATKVLQHSSKDDTQVSGMFGNVAFSSDKLPPALDDRARFSRWRDFMHGVYGSLELFRLSDRPFSQRMKITQFDGSGVMRFRGTTNRMVRTSRTVAASVSQDFFFTLNRSPSSVRLSQVGRDAIFEPGGACLCHAAEGGEFEAEDDSAFTMVTIRHERLLKLVPGAEDLLARPLPGGTATLRYLRQYLDFIDSRDDTGGDPALAAHVETTLTDLIALALGARSGGGRTARLRGLRAARLQAIKVDVEKHVAYPDLSVTTVAARHGISPRYVQALFEDEGTTFSTFVLTQRLARAHRLLSSPRHMDRRIADIAFSAGFGDLSHFNRAFRRQYGLTPSDTRAQALIEPGPDTRQIG